MTISLHHPARTAKLPNDDSENRNNTTVCFEFITPPPDDLQKPSDRNSAWKRRDRPPPLARVRSSVTTRTICHGFTRFHNALESHPMDMGQYLLVFFLPTIIRRPSSVVYVTLTVRDEVYSRAPSVAIVAQLRLRRHFLLQCSITVRSST